MVVELLVGIFSTNQSILKVSNAKKSIKHDWCNRYICKSSRWQLEWLY